MERDLVLRLIEAAEKMPPTGDLFLPAAHRIDELEAEIKRLRAAIQDAIDHLNLEWIANAQCALEDAIEQSAKLTKGGD